MTYPYRYEFQRWLKAVERGTVIFMERELEGKAPDFAELRRLREEVLAQYPRPPSLVERMTNQVGQRIGSALGRIVGREWSKEEQGTVGLFTRLGLAQAAYRDLGGVRAAVRSLRTGRYLPSEEDGSARTEARRVAEQMLVAMVQRNADAARAQPSMTET